MKIDRELQLVVPGHSVSASQMSLAVSDEVLHVEAVRNSEQTDDVRVYKAFNC